MRAILCRRNVEFTAVFREVPEGYVGFVEELPGANTQGATLEEACRNLVEATKLRDLVRHLESHGCKKLREGGNHTV